MTVKYVDSAVCEERHKYIKESLDTLNTKMDIVMENHIPHLKTEMAKIMATYAVVLGIILAIIQHYV